MPEMNRSMTHPNSENPTDGGATDAGVQASLELTEQERPLAQADERVPEREPDLLEQVAELAARGEMSAAQVTVRALIAREPGNARARAVLAGLLEKKGDAEGALTELGRALESAPDDVSILCARATLLASRARYDQAEVDLRRAARINPRSPDVQVQLGILFSKRARWREAVEPLLAAIAADASHGDAHYYLGEAYNHIDELPSALSSYEMAASLQPTSMRALKGIGIVLDRMGRPAEAAAAYRRARETQKR
jgi:tetratricopeptide (TPR) repeat protein